MGPKGQTIKQIQLKTQTYIVTPSRERDPVFEITGLPESVEQARIEISNYIAARTGTFIDSEKKAIAPAVSVANTWNGERCVSYAKESVMPEEINEFLEEIFSGGPNGRSPIVKHDKKRNSLDALSGDHGQPESASAHGLNDQYAMWNHGFGGNLKSVLPMNSSVCSDIMQTGCVSNDPSSSGSSSAYSSFSFEASPLVRSSSYPVSVNSSEVANVANEVAAAARKASDNQLPNVHESASSSVALHAQQWAPAMTAGGSVVDPHFVPMTSSIANPIGTYVLNGVNNANRGMDGAAARLPVPLMPVLGVPDEAIKNCVICKTNGISAALVPCGHNLFCYDCVSSLVQSNNSYCPVCHQPADHALRILQ